MKPKIKLATAKTPDGGEMVLYQHERNFSIDINSQNLMHSREHESELELARQGCAHLAGVKKANILIGGLGMGYTLRQALNILKPNAQVLVIELLDAVIEWNGIFFGDINGHCLNDKRVDVKTGDIVPVITSYNNQFDAILLDIDNGPDAMTDKGNYRLYSRKGLLASHRALRDKGRMTLWSADQDKDKKFEQLLTSCGFLVDRIQVPAYKGSKARSRVIWVASKDNIPSPPPVKKSRTNFKKEFKKSLWQARKKS